MNKKISVIIAGLLILSGCSGEKSDNDISESIVETDTIVEETEVKETEAPTIRPTERIRDIESAEDFEYEIVDGGVTITKYTGNSTSVEIPGEIENLPVTKIGFFAFEAKFLIESVTLPETVQVICEGAFTDCSSLYSINLPQSLESIERSAFAACTALESLDIPASVKSIDMEAFTACDSLSSVTINNPALEYNNWGFEELPYLTIYASSDSKIYNWAVGNNISVAAL